MSLIGAYDIESARGPVTVGRGDVLTPLARDRAAELGVELRFTSDPAVADPPPAPAPSRARADTTGPAPRTVDSETLNTLYRRGAPVAAALAPDPPGPGRGGKPRAAVVGAGHVGSVATLRLAESDLFAEVVLVDVVDGLAAGVALDLWHSAGLGSRAGLGSPAGPGSRAGPGSPADRGSFATIITGGTDLAELGGVDYVIVTAGQARKPGMTRTDLTQANAAIVGPIAEAIARYAPAAVIVVVTNPLEEMTHLAQLRSGFRPGRVLGMAGVLDSARFAALVGLTGVCRPDEVIAYALGSHGPEMVIPLSQARAQGRALTDLLDRDTLAAIITRTRDSGAEVVSLLKTGSAYFAPGQSAAAMVAAMASSSPEVMACAVVPAGEYGLRDTRVGLPVRLGPAGLAEIVTLNLDTDETAALRAAADSLGQRIREVG